MIDPIGGSVLTTILLAVAMFMALEIGHRLGIRAVAEDPDSHKGTGPIEGAVFGLIGLILAFTVSGAQTRFNARIALIVDEATAIATVHDRADLLPENDRTAVRELVRAYLDERVGVYQPGTDKGTREAHRAAALRLQREIWARSELGCRSVAPSCASLLLPAVEELRTIATARVVAQNTHMPWIIVLLMCVLVTSGAALAGYALAARRSRRWMHWSLFVVSLLFTVFVILDLEHPREGLIRVQAVDAVLTGLREIMR